MAALLNSQTQFFSMMSASFCSATSSNHHDSSIFPPQQSEESQETPNNPFQEIQLNAEAEPFTFKRQHSSPEGSDMYDSDLDPPFSPASKPPTKKSKNENHVPTRTEIQIASMQQQIKDRCQDALTQWEARKRLKNCT